MDGARGIDGEAFALISEEEKAEHPSLHNEVSKIKETDAPGALVPDDPSIYDNLQDLIPSNVLNLEDIQPQSASAIWMTSSVHVPVHHENNPSESVAKHAPLKNGDIDSETQMSKEDRDFVREFPRDKITVVPPAIHPDQPNIHTQDSKSLDNVVPFQAALRRSREDTSQGLKYYSEPVKAASQATNRWLPPQNEHAGIHTIPTETTNSYGPSEEDSPNHKPFTPEALQS
ncbi:hypothetical protein CROQUDRAFT_460712 [Cronartium quercuum f. sp. fusiforme G11]|uniref:Uncharacterized protein n=1 Tax=Cronartium quercuum f. sp. fusiforme G11 TaxID=708437 RepID=A0A9P6N820_9BASI|nr:hypothetical protein CROQUDRAFT_460712 [Cronartium quercuum f. sp. fusiforme G11]